MKQEKVLVVGGSSGIGLASARRLAQEGYKVVITARTQARVDAALGRIGGAASGQALDYADRAGIAAAFAQIGAFDHLVVAGAGPAAWGAFAELSGDALRAAFDSKFWGYFDTLQAALPTLADRGSITLVSGAAARVALPGTAGLAAVNGAIERMGLTLAKELAPRRVNILSPGLVDTPAYDWMAPEARRCSPSVLALGPARRPGDCPASAARYGETGRAGNGGCRAPTTGSCPECSPPGRSWSRGRRP
ncbi:MAG: SDR family NAD(P)-dependent oxidoreductase [Rhodocyclaceae bacterium]|nr:SDR family NAD(P)-dependent oxidoreductase [Rhodocyclaceae bacterium]